MLGTKWVGALTVGIVALGLFSAGTPSLARSLDFSDTPVTDAVAQMDRVFGIDIVIRPGVKAERNVTFSVDDLSQRGARLDAVNQLANELGADFHKYFVIKRITDGSAVQPPAIDSDAPVVFPAQEVLIKQAIETVAGVDGATVQFYSPVIGNVRLANTVMNAPDAASEIARQTSTRWKAVYELTPRTQSNAAAGGTIIGHTAAGSPIIEMPLVTFRTFSQPEPQTPSPPLGTRIAGASSTGNTAGNANPQAPNGGQNGMTAQNDGYYYGGAPYGYYSPYGYGYSPYGYSPYGYSPYGYSPYDYAQYGYSQNGFQQDEFTSGALNPAGLSSNFPYTVTTPGGLTSGMMPPGGYFSPGLTILPQPVLTYGPQVVYGGPPGY